MRFPTPGSVPRPQPGPVLTRAVLAAAEQLDLRSRHLAAVLGTSEGSVLRLRSDREISPNSKEGELALLFLRAHRSLEALMGGDETKARLWLHAENSHHRGIPSERIRTVEGLVDVVQYLDALRGRL